MPGVHLTATEREVPGTNEKRYLAGSIRWRTGRVLLATGRPKAEGMSDNA